MPVLESYRGRDIVGVEELARVATSLVEQYSREPGRANVRLGLTPRTVRHYLSESLLGETTGQTGTSTIFNYGNLLRLLAVKKLLADHWSVVKIKEFMRALDITALEELVNSALASAQKPGRDSIAAGEKESAARGGGRVRERPHTDGTEDAQTSAQHASFLHGQPPQLASLAVESARGHERALAEWIEIAPGLEIKVRHSFRPPASEEDRARLVQRFWSVIIKEEEKEKKG